MPRFAANISMMYQEYAFLDRFDAAAGDGFEAMECLFPYDHDADTLATRLQRAGLSAALINLPAGHWEGGDRGLACLPERRKEFVQSVEIGLGYALALGVRKIHILAGKPGADLSPLLVQQTYVDNLRLACDRMAEHGIMALIEPINRRDMPAYYLTHQQQAHDICALVNRPNIRVQMDLYHCQIVEGDLIRRIQTHLPGVGHIQIAGVPDRHEPDVGEVNYSHILPLLDQLGYAGHVGCEYRPRAGTSAGLGWMRRLQAGRTTERG